MEKSWFGNLGSCTSVRDGALGTERAQRALSQRGGCAPRAWPPAGPRLFVVLRGRRPDAL